MFVGFLFSFFFLYTLVPIILAHLLFATRVAGIFGSLSLNFFARLLSDYQRGGRWEVFLIFFSNWLDFFGWIFFENVHTHVFRRSHISSLVV